MSAEKIIVASTKGGIGKTTVALGLATALVEKGKKVLLCDLDFENKCLDLYMGISEYSLYSIFDVLCGRITPDKAIMKNNKGLFFVAAPNNVQVGLVHDDSTMTPDELLDTLNELVRCTEPDYVICDTSAGHIIPRILAREFATCAIVVASHQPASQIGAQRTATLLGKEGLEDVRLVITDYNHKDARKDIRTDLIGIIDGSGVKLAGVIPFDRDLLLSHENGIMVPAKSISSVAFSNIAKRFMGQSVKLFTGISSSYRKDMY